MLARRELDGPRFISLLPSLRKDVLEHRKLVHSPSGAIAIDFVRRGCMSPCLGVELQKAACIRPLLNKGEEGASMAVGDRPEVLYEKDRALVVNLGVAEKFSIAAARANEI